MRQRPSTLQNFLEDLLAGNHALIAELRPFLIKKYEELQLSKNVLGEDEFADLFAFLLLDAKITEDLIKSARLITQSIDSLKLTGELAHTSMLLESQLSYAYAAKKILRESSVALASELTPENYEKFLEFFKDATTVRSVDKSLATVINSRDLDPRSDEIDEFVKRHCIEIYSLNYKCESERELFDKIVDKYIEPESLIISPALIAESQGKAIKDPSDAEIIDEHKDNLIKYHYDQICEHYQARALLKIAQEFLSNMIDSGANIGLNFSDNEIVDNDNNASAAVSADSDKDQQANSGKIVDDNSNAPTGPKTISESNNQKQKPRLFALENLPPHLKDAVKSFAEEAIPKHIKESKTSLNLRETKKFLINGLQDKIYKKIQEERLEINLVASKFKKFIDECCEFLVRKRPFRTLSSRSREAVFLTGTHTVFKKSFRMFSQQSKDLFHKQNAPPHSQVPTI